MASVTRQPFAPLDGTRLKNLTSLKNRQNSVSNPNPVKRKASESFDSDDFENLDPKVFSKRSKAAGDGSTGFVKPATSSFILTQSTAVSNDENAAPAFPASTLSPTKPSSRSVLNPKSPASKLNTSLARSSPLSVPAGRSPTRGKRAGILSSSRRRTAGGSFGRVDPPSFGISSLKSSSARSTPFSLDAALKGTLSSYAGRPSTSTPAPATLSSDLYGGSDSKSSWFFDIHEDTPEQEMTNLLQHSTCVLDISSDEESERKRLRERAEGKENVPPSDDVSQTTSSNASRARAAAGRAGGDGDMDVEKERSPLGEMDVKAYYSEGCDENSVIIVPGEEYEDGEQPQQHAPQDQQQQNFEFAPQIKSFERSLSPEASATVPAENAQCEADASESQSSKSVEQLMLEKPEDDAAVLQPMEGTGESFEVWESGSTKDESESAGPTTPTPIAETEA